MGTTRTGPNNVSHIVWALGMLSLHVFTVLTNYLWSFQILSTSLRIWEGGTDEKSPNYVSCIVWAIGNIFFCSLLVFTVLTKYLCSFQVLYTVIGLVSAYAWWCTQNSSKHGKQLFLYFYSFSSLYTCSQSNHMSTQGHMSTTQDPSDVTLAHDGSLFL